MLDILCLIEELKKQYLIPFNIYQCRINDLYKEQVDVQDELDVLTKKKDELKNNIKKLEISRSQMRQKCVKQMLDELKKKNIKAVVCANNIGFRVHTDTDTFTFKL